MKKVMALLLTIIVVCMCSTSAWAANADVIDSIHNIVAEMYESAESAPQQTSAAAMGSMYMLNIILNETSSNQTRKNAVTDFLSVITDEIGNVEGAPQASALSLYGCDYILSALAYEKDKTGLYGDLITQTLDSLYDADTNSAVQEMALASYRMVDLLGIIGLEVGVPTTTIATISQILSDNNDTVSGAPQQTANGLYRAAETIYYIAKEDCAVGTSLNIANLLDTMYADNEKCSSAVQQTSNGMSTIYLMLYAVAMDKA